jgi:hypothetical protein
VPKTGGRGEVFCSAEPPQGFRFISSSSDSRKVYAVFLKQDIIALLMFLCLNVLMFSKQFILTWTAFLSFNYAKNRSARCQKPEAVCQKPEGIMPKTGGRVPKTGRYYAKNRE